MSIVDQAMQLRKHFSWTGVLAALDEGTPPTLTYDTIMFLGLSQSPSASHISLPPLTDPVWNHLRNLTRASIAAGSEIGNGWRVVNCTENSVTFMK